MWCPVSFLNDFGSSLETVKLYAEYMFDFKFAHNCTSVYQAPTSVEAQILADSFQKVTSSELAPLYPTIPTTAFNLILE